MIQTISYQEIDGIYDTTSFDWGSTAKVFAMVETENPRKTVYKNYLRPIVLSRITSRNITYLEHLTNLSEIISKELIVPKIAVTNPIAIVGIIMDKAPGMLLNEQNVPIEEIVKSKNEIREAILDISSHFEIFDLNTGSIFYSSTYGITLVDLESYIESSGDYSFINLYRFYSKVVDVLHYVPELKNRICLELQKGIDYCRLEVIYDVVMKYLKEKGLDEEDVKVFVKK